VLNIFCFLARIGQYKLLIAKGDEHYKATKDDQGGNYFIDAYASCFHGNNLIVPGEDGQGQEVCQQYCHRAHPVKHLRDLVEAEKHRKKKGGVVLVEVVKVLYGKIDYKEQTRTGAKAQEEELHKFSADIASDNRHYSYPYAQSIC
jgi:hypothetical protein